MLLSAKPRAILAAWLMARYGRLLLALSASGALVGYLGAWHWVAELAAHFVVQYALASALAALLLWGAGERRWAVAALVLMSVMTWRVVDYYYWPAVAKPPTSAAPIVRIVQYNAALQAQPLFDWLESQGDGADIVTLVEVDQRFEPSLKRLQTRYPHHIARLGGVFGMAILSRYPLRNAHELDPTGLGISALTADVVVEGWSAPLRLYVAHPPPPLGSELVLYHRAYWQALRAEWAASPPLTAVVGDFNTTPWAPGLSAIMRDFGLVDCQRGWGLLGSWPAPLAQWTPLLGLPIDGCLHAAGLRSLGRTTGPALGSDHLPVITLLAPR